MKKPHATVLKHMSIWFRLGLLTMLAFGAITLVGTFGYVGLRHSNFALTDAATATTAVLNQKQADMMHDALRADVLSAMVTGPGGRQEVSDQIRQDLASHSDILNASITVLSALALDPQVRTDVENLKPELSAYVAAADSTVSIALTNQDKGAKAYPTFLIAFSALEEKMGALGELIELRANVATDEAKATNKLVTSQMLIVAVGAAVVFLGANIWISRSITVPLARVVSGIRDFTEDNIDERSVGMSRVDEVTEIAGSLVHLQAKLREARDISMAMKRSQDEQHRVVAALGVGLRNLSEGNLTETIETAFSDDYEVLRKDFNQTVDRLNQTITQVVKASKGIRERSDDLRNSSDELGRRTEVQATTLEQTASALDELTTSVKAAAAGAREVESIVQSARKEAEDNGKVVLGAVEAMNGIEQSSDQISRIIGVIDDIAFQTNLLALNAGVEAARAGDSGRGFAVVASEVRALAQRSSDASKEIKDLISSSTVLVGRGVEAVGSAGRALTSLVDRVTHISTLVSGIATGASQQSTALAEVNIGVTQLDQVAQRNAAMVEQSMTAAQSLQQEALGMDNLVAHFETRVRSPKTQPRPRAVASR